MATIISILNEKGGTLLIRFVIQNSRKGIKASADISDKKTLSFMVHQKEEDAAKDIFKDHLTKKDWFH